MSNLIDSSLPEEDSNWPEQQPGSNPTNISTGFGSSPFDDYAVKDMDLTNEPFGSSNVPSSGPTPFVPTVEGDLLNMSSEEIKSTPQSVPHSVPHSAPQSAPRSPPPPPPPVFSQPEPTIKTEPTSTIQPEVKPVVDIKPEEPKQPKSEAKEIKKQDDKKDSKSKSDEAPSSSSHYCSFLTRNPHIADLVYWRDLKKSGIVFVAGLLLLLSLACCSIISVISHGSLLLVGCTLAYRIYTNVMQAVQKTDEGHPFKEYMEMDIIPSEEKFIELVGKAYNPLKVTLIKLKSIFLIEDYVDSIKYSVFFWCLTYVGAWFNGITLVTLFYLGLFSVPKLYEMNKSQIDVHLASVCTQLEGLCSQVKTKLPFLASKKEKSQ